MSIVIIQEEMMEFFKNVKLEKVSDTEYILTIKISEMFNQTFKLTADQLEHVISSYRLVK